MKKTTLNTSQRFVALPYVMFQVEGLKTNDVLVYAHMANDYPFYFNEKGQYQPSEANIAKILGINRKTVGTVITKLEELDYIEAVSRKDGCCTVWHVNEINDKGLPIIRKAPVTKRTEVMTDGVVKSNIEVKKSPPIVQPVPEWATAPCINETPY